MGELVPISVGAFFCGIVVTEDVGEAVGKEFVEPSAFDGQKADVRFVGLWAGQIYLLMRHVHVAGNEDGDLFGELVRKFQEGVVKVQLVLELFGRAAAVREVAIDEDEVLEMEHEGAALLVEAGNTEAIFHFAWLFLRIHGYTAVAFFVCGDGEIRMIAGNVHGLGRKLGGIALGFLQGEDVRILALEKGEEEIVAQSGAQAVRVPREDFHGFTVSPSAALTKEMKGVPFEITVLKKAVLFMKKVFCSGPSPQNGCNSNNTPCTGTTAARKQAAAKNNKNNNGQGHQK